MVVGFAYEEVSHTTTMTTGDGDGGKDARMRDNNTLWRRPESLATVVLLVNE